MRADRLLAIMAHLSLGGRLSASELARRLEVSARTIYRDIDALCQAGVPVVADVGVHGGFSLLETFRTQPGWLTARDIDALFVPQTDGPWHDLGLDRARQEAWLKLAANLSGPQREQTLRLRNRLLLDESGWFEPQERAASLPLLQAAVATDAVVRITYERHLGEPRDYVLEPYALVFKGGAWYVVAADRGLFKAFRTSRMGHVEITNDRFTRDPGFRLPEFWGGLVRAFEGSLPRYAATLRVAPDLMPSLPYLLGESIRGAARSGVVDPDTGWSTLAVIFDSEAAAASAILSLGPGAEALGPASLRSRVAAQAQAVATRYAGALDSPAASG